jgi:hypothetical protein
VFQKLRNITPKNKRGSTSDKKRGSQHFKNKKHALKRKGFEASDEKEASVFQKLTQP